MPLAIAGIDGVSIANPRVMAKTIVERMGVLEMREVRRRGAGDNVVCMQESMDEGPAAALEITAVSCVEPLEPIPCCAGATIETTCKCKVDFISAATRARSIAMADSQKKSDMWRGESCVGCRSKQGGSSAFKCTRHMSDKASSKASGCAGAVKCAARRGADGKPGLPIAH